MQTVVETPLYLKSAVSLFSVEEREAIVNMVASDPECGDLIQGTGGFGKSGSVLTAWEKEVERALFIFFATKAFRSF